ncbi:hypothetical protein DRO34_04070 [Candidatus Bathyarchaeota archaeon]|nr:MAG: hypothetical protein DRO34_04070 [Candidatus Bathyarchaeota archaeon]
MLRKMLMRGLVTALFALILTQTNILNLTANASPLTVDISPTSGAVGTVIEVWGVADTFGGEIRVFWDDRFIGATTSNATGHYRIEIEAPESTKGTHIIRVWDITSGNNATKEFEVSPEIELTPTEGSPPAWGMFGRNVTIKGTGFNGFSSITVYFSAISVASTTTNDFGSFETSFRIPSMPNGTYTVEARDSGGNSATANFTIIPKIVTMPTSGSPFTPVRIFGSGFDANANVTATFNGFNITSFNKVSTDLSGIFIMEFYVPEVADGKYTIEATDSSGNSAEMSFLVPGPRLMVKPEKACATSIITVYGEGFDLHHPIVVTVNDTKTMTRIWTSLMTGEAFPDEYGRFELSFEFPASKPGIYNVTAERLLEFEEALVTEPVVWTLLTIVDASPLNVEVDVGTIHFPGEIAEFYIQTEANGTLVDASINRATLYYANGTQQVDLTANVETVSTGIYRIPYAIPGDASPGTYALIVEASYEAELIQAQGTGQALFTLNPTLIEENALITQIQGQIATVLTQMDYVRLNLTAIQAKIASIEENIATIQTNIGTLKTDVENINAQVESIDGNTATITSDLGEVKKKIAPYGLELGIASTVFSCLAAIAASIGVLLSRRKIPPKTPTPTPETSPSPSPPPTEEKPETPAV